MKYSIRILLALFVSTTFVAHAQETAKIPDYTPGVVIKKMGAIPSIILTDKTNLMRILTSRELEFNKEAGPARIATDEERRQFLGNQKKYYSEVHDQKLSDNAPAQYILATPLSASQMNRPIKNNLPYYDEYIASKVTPYSMPVYLENSKNLDQAELYGIGDFGIFDTMHLNRYNGNIPTVIQNSDYGISFILPFTTADFSYDTNSKGHSLKIEYGIPYPYTLEFNQLKSTGYLYKSGHLVLDFSKISPEDKEDLDSYLNTFGGTKVTEMTRDVFLKNTLEKVSPMDTLVLYDGLTGQTEHTTFDWTIAKMAPFTTLTSNLNNFGFLLRSEPYSRVDITTTSPEKGESALFFYGIANITVPSVRPYENLLPKRMHQITIEKNVKFNYGYNWSYNGSEKTDDKTTYYFSNGSERESISTVNLSSLMQEPDKKDLRKYTAHMMNATYDIPYIKRPIINGLFLYVKDRTVGYVFYGKNTDNHLPPYFIKYITDVGNTRIISTIDYNDNLSSPLEKQENSPRFAKALQEVTAFTRKNSF